MAFSDAAGNALEPSMVVDNKDKATVAEADIRKLVRYARGHSVRRGACPYARPHATLFLRHLRRRGLEPSDSARTAAANFRIRV
jgi:hypothetical protein